MRDLWTEVNITGPKMVCVVKAFELEANVRLHTRRRASDQREKSIYVVTGCSLLGSGTSIDVNMLRTCYWTHMKYKGPDDLDCDTEDEVWKYIQGIWTPGSVVCARSVGSADSKAQGRPLAGGVSWYLGQRRS